MVKIEKEQMSGIKLKSTVPLFLLYPVCYEIQYFVLNDDVGASKTMALASSRNEYLPDIYVSGFFLKHTARCQ